MSLHRIKYILHVDDAPIGPGIGYTSPSALGRLCFRLKAIATSCLKSAGQARPLSVVRTEKLSKSLTITFAYIAIETHYHYSLTG